jgi:hypothetical protein
MCSCLQVLFEKTYHSAGAGEVEESWRLPVEQNNEDRYCPISKQLNKVQDTRDSGELSNDFSKGIVESPRCRTFIISNPMNARFIPA